MKKTHALALTACLISGSAHASCGAAFCSSSNDWLSLTQGVTQGWRIWGQLEYLKQDQLKAGTKNVAPGSSGGHHEEVKTLNRNALLGLTYGFASEWSAGVVVPYSNRDHRHIHYHHGAALPETWQFDAIGDVRVKLQYQPLARPFSSVSWNLHGGLKLPTGKIDGRNAEGDEAERSVQPGSGTTDVLLGGGFAYAPLSLPGSLFTNLTVQLPLNQKDGYQPGRRSSMQAGWLIPVYDKLDLTLQANVLLVGRDRGTNAEPDDSGRTEVALVPGLAYAWSRNLSLYGQLERPVYQNVRGMQLTHDFAVSVGLSLALN